MLVLTKKFLFTFRDDQSYSNPTEVIEMQECQTVKTADDELGKANTFVRSFLS